MECVGSFEEYYPKPVDYNETLSIAKIRTDGGSRPRAKLNQSAVDEYTQLMREGRQFKPVTVFYDGLDYWLSQGFHRIAAALKAGRLTFLTEIRQGTLRDAILDAVSANSQNETRLTNLDKRRSIMLMFADLEWSQWSNNKIARTCGATDSLVRTLRKELSSIKSKITNFTNDLSSIKSKIQSLAHQDWLEQFGVDEAIVCQALQHLEPQSYQRLAKRGNTTYSINTAKCGRSKPPASPLAIASKAKPTTVEVLPPLLGSNTQPVAQIPPVTIDIPTLVLVDQGSNSDSMLDEAERMRQQLCSITTTKLPEKVKSVISDHPLRGTEVITEVKALLETGEDTLSEEPPVNQLRVTNVEWEAPCPPNGDQTLKIPLRIWVKGPAHVLPALFEQIRGNPDLTDLICNEFSNSLEAIAELVA